MSRYVPENKTNFSDYSSLKSYNKSTLGIPTAGDNDPNTNKNKYMQVVPKFVGFDYEKPNYNSLTTGTCCSNYADINSSYGNVKGDCVGYVQRPCKQ